MNLNAPVLLFAECNTCNCWDKMPPKLMVMKNNNLVFTVSTQCVFKFNWKRKHFDASKVSSIWDQIKLNFVSFLVRFDKNVFKGQNYFNRDISEVNGHGFESSDRNTENEARNDKPTLWIRTRVITTILLSFWDFNISLDFFRFMAITAITFSWQRNFLLQASKWIWWPDSALPSAWPCPIGRGASWRRCWGCSSATWRPPSDYRKDRTRSSVSRWPGSKISFIFIFEIFICGSWWWSSGQSACLLLWQSEFESCWSLLCKIWVRKERKRGRGCRI